MPLYRTIRLVTQGSDQLDVNCEIVAMGARCTVNVTTRLAANAWHGREPPKQAKLAVGSSNRCCPLKIMSWNHRFSLLQRSSHWRTMHFLCSSYECDSQDWPVIFGKPEIRLNAYERLVTRSLSAVSEAPPSEELGVEKLYRGASDTAT